MAVSLGTVHRKGMADYMLHCDVTLDNSYPTGGYALTPSQFGMAVSLDFVLPHANGAGYLASWNPTTGKLMIFWAAGFTPAGTNSAPTITTSSGGASPVVAVVAGALSQAAGATGITGVQAPTFTGTPVAAGALVEVTNGTDLSALIVHCLIFGR